MHDITELFALVIGDRRAQILDFNQPLALNTTCATSWIPVIHE